MVVGILLLPVQADARIMQKAFRTAAGYVRACSGSLSMRTPAEPAEQNRQEFQLGSLQTLYSPIQVDISPLPLSTLIPSSV